MGEPEAYRTVRRLARHAGVPNPGRVHPHALRHMAVTLALDSRANPVDVQDMAEHADPRTTRRYDRARGCLDCDSFYALAALRGWPTVGVGRCTRGDLGCGHV